MKKSIKFLWLVFASATIAFAVVFSLFRSLTPWVAQYRGEVEQQLSQLLGESVHIGAMETGWYWFEPVIKLKNVTLKNKHHPIIHVGFVSMGLDIPASLWNWQWRPGVMVLSDLRLSLRQTTSGWKIDGMVPGSTSIDPAQIDQYAWFSEWLLHQKTIKMDRTQLRLQLLDGSVIPLGDLHLHLQNSHQHYLLQTSAVLLQTTPSRVELQGSFDIDNADINQASGKMHIHFKDILLPQWLALLKLNNYQVNSGLAGGQLWLSFAKGNCVEGQAQVNIKNLSLLNEQKQSQTFVQSFRGDLNWFNHPDKFRLSADKLKMRVNGVKWPLNQFLFTTDKDDGLMQVDLGYFDLALLSALMPQNESHPLPFDGLGGIVKNIHVRWKSQKIQHFFAQFSHLSWAKNTSLPAVTGLDGVIQSEADHGRMRLDSNHVAIDFVNQPPVVLDTLAADLSWNRHDDGWALQIHDSTLVHPHFEMNAQGTVNHLNADNNPDLNLSAHFSTRNMEFWKPWLPREFVKPKFYDWICNDVKKIPILLGKVDLKGPWKAFPFDKNEGVFSIQMAGEGIALSPLPGWPLAHSLKGVFDYSGRSLQATIYDGWFGDIVMKQMNLKLDGIGLDKEVLTLHTRLRTATQNAIDYLLHTNLKSLHGVLNQFKVEGPMELDLQVEVPFSEPPADIQILGDIHLDNNTIEVGFDGLPLKLTEVNGNFQFDQLGVLDSQLDIALWKIPLQIQMRSSSKEKPGLHIKAHFPFEVARLSQQWPSPLWQMLSGQTEFDLNMDISADPQNADQIHLTSLLKGLSIHLPAPFNKDVKQATALKMDIEFNPTRGFLVKTQWNNILGTHLWFSQKDGVIVLKKGEIRIGSTSASTQVKQGVQLLGHLKNFDAMQWKSVFDRMKGNNSGSISLGELNFVDVLLDKVDFMGQHLKAVQLKAHLNHQIWQIVMQDKRMKGTMSWNVPDNALSIQLNQLTLPTSSGTDWPVVKPHTFPSIDLNIQHLYAGSSDLGQLKLKGHPHDKQWLLRSLSLKNGEYELHAEGAWKADKAQPVTSLSVGVQLKNMSGILKRFNYPDMIDAKRGYIEFNGQWSGAIYNPKLERLKGNIHFSLKDGLISELSKETEEKIGLGKMLSIFSLQTIPRRLRLNFSDLSSKGYTFDILEGKLQLEKGQLTTRDSAINGPVAHASIKGRFDLTHQICDFKIRITPHITASLPVVATIAGGPVAGIATWVINKIVSREIDKVSGYTYLVKGPWSHPEITPAEITHHRVKRG